MSNRTTEQDVDRMIENDARQYHLKQFDGKLPSNLVDLYKKAIYCGIPSVHRQQAKMVKSIISKRFDELNNYEVGKVCNQILGAPTASVWDSLDEALEDLIILEELSEKYNKDSKAFEQAMFKKRESLRKMAGLDPSSVPFKLHKT